MVFAAIFIVAWLVKPDFRRQIEHPKHEFQDQVQRYDQQCRAETRSAGVESDEPR
jgi:hypothetical protein